MDATVKQIPSAASAGMRGGNCRSRLNPPSVKKNSRTPAEFHAPCNGDSFPALAVFHPTQQATQRNSKPPRSMLAVLEIDPDTDDARPANEPAGALAFRASATFAVRIQSERCRRSSGKAPKLNCFSRDRVTCSQF